MPTSLARDTATTITAQAPHDSPHARTARKSDARDDGCSSGGGGEGQGEGNSVSPRKQETRKTAKRENAKHARTATVENASAQGSKAGENGENVEHASARTVDGKDVESVKAVKAGENAEAVSVVADKPTSLRGIRGGGRRGYTDEQADQVRAMVVADGQTIESAAQVVSVSPTVVRRILNASGEAVEALQKDMVPRLDKIASIAGEQLLVKLQNDGHRMSGSELSIIQGVAIQRGVDLKKLPTTSAPPDWAALAGWSGTQDGGTVDDGKGGDK